MEFLNSNHYTIKKSPQKTLAPLKDFQTDGPIQASLLGNEVISNM